MSSRELGHRPCLEAHPSEATLTCNLKQMLNHSPAEALTPTLGDDVHRLDFPMPRINFDNRPDCDHHTVGASTEEEDLGREQTLGIQVVVA